MKKLKKRLLATMLASSCMFSAVAMNSNSIYWVGPLPDGYTEFDDHGYFTRNSPYGESKFYHKGNNSVIIEEQISYPYFRLEVSSSLTKEEIASYFMDSDYFDDYEITIGNPSTRYPQYPISVGFHSDKVSEKNAREFYKKIQETGIKEPEMENFRGFKFRSTSSSFIRIYFWGDGSEDITDYFYSSADKKDVSAILQQYVEENNLDFTVVTESCNPPKKNGDNECDMRCHLIPNEEITIDEHFEVASKIYSDLGIYVPMIVPASDTEGTGYSIDVLNSIDGDANEDGNVNMADATAVVQAIGNPDMYALTPQGEFNADVDGDGLTGMDAVEIQIKVASAGMPE